MHRFLTWQVDFIDKFDWGLNYNFSFDCILKMALDEVVKPFNYCFADVGGLVFIALFGNFFFLL